MTRRVIRESLEGGSIEVELAHGHYVSVGAFQLHDDGEAGGAVVYLTRAESDQLIDALIAANQEIDAARTTRATDTTSAVTS